MAEKETSYTQVKATTQSLIDEVKGYRLTGDKLVSRNLPSLSQERMIDICYWLWDNYPMAKWIINVLTSFIVAEELPFESPNPLIQRILKDFWFDPVNRMDLYLKKHVQELHIFGDICFPVKVSPSNGRLRLGYIDPKDIDQVYTDPENCKIVIGVLLKASPGEVARSYKTVLEKDVENFLSPKAKVARATFRSGDCFFFSINNVTNSPRGRSELLTVADWIDTYENFLYDFAEKWSQLNTFLWDLSVKDATEDVIRDKVTQLNKASGNPGSIFGHNDNIVLTAITPDLRSLDVDVGSRIIRNHILGGVGLPSHWYGGAEDVNKSSADEMMTPTMKILTEKQNYFKYILSSIFNYQIYCARKFDRTSYGSIKDDEIQYTIITPELSTKDLGKFGAVIKNVADGLAVAEDRRWLDKTTSLEYFSLVMSFLGRKVDPELVKKRLENEPKEEKKEEKVIND